MMKVLRYAALKLAGILSLGLGLLSLVSQPVLHFVAHGCESMSCGLDKLEPDLAHMRAQADIGAEEISSDLKRESHGYRQSSAPSPTGFANLAMT